MEKLNFKNSRGLNLVGDFYKSDSEKGVILLHGFRADRHESGRFDFVAEKLHQEGFNVLAFDFSGSGKSDDEPLNTDNQAQDLRDALKFFKYKGIEKIGVVGMSLGSIAIFKNKNLFEKNILAVVLWAPVTSKREDYAQYRFSKEQLKELRETGIITYVKEFPGISRERFKISNQIIDERENLDQNDFLSNVNLPILIIHGDKDTFVPLDWSKKAMEIFPKGSELKILEGEGHRFENKRGQLVEETIKWFKKNLI